MISSLLLLSLLSLKYVYSDIPVHCLHKQALGNWEFQLSDNNHDKYLKCGYEQPDKNIKRFTSYDYELEVKNTLYISLESPNVAKLKDTDITGTWTLIYDEGFEVRINDQVYFSFFAYEPKSAESLKNIKVENYISHCDQTWVGFYHTLSDNTKYGCYRAQKVGVSPFKPTVYKVLGKDMFEEADPDAIVSPIDLDGDQSEEKSQLEMQAEVFVGQSSKIGTKMFIADSAFVDMVNADSSSMWQARMPSEFEGMSMAAVNKMRGHSKIHKADLVVKAAKDVPQGTGITHGTGSIHFNDDDQKFLTSNSFPKNLDWRSKDGSSFESPIKNQGKCGSCYAVATVQVAEDRLRILTKNVDKTILSPQEVNSCSRVNQGCKGGYPFLVAKHAYEFGLTTEDCMPYKGDNDCSRKCKDPKLYYGKADYGYVGGYYGGCNEREMIKSLQGGPIVAALYVPKALFYYKSGVFIFEEGKHVGRLPRIEDGWEETTHAISIIGYGVETVDGKEVKYWIVRNTWGPVWGDNGHFKIARGSDMCNIESMAVVLNIDPVAVSPSVSDQ